MCEIILAAHPVTTVAAVLLYESHSKLGISMRDYIKRKSSKCEVKFRFLLFSSVPRHCCAVDVIFDGAQSKCKCRLVKEL